MRAAAGSMHVGCELAAEGPEEDPLKKFRMGSSSAADWEPLI